MASRRPGVRAPSAPLGSPGLTRAAPRSARGREPFAAGKIAGAHGDHVPFYIGAAAVVGAIAVLATAHELLAGAQATQAAEALAAIPEPFDSEADLLMEGAR